MQKSCRRQAPGLINLYDCFEDKDNYYTITKFFRGGNLKDYLSQKIRKEKKFLTESDVRHIMYQLAVGVKELHSRNVIHRDIKMANILVNEDTDNKIDVRLTDFGCAGIL